MAGLAEFCVPSTDSGLLWQPVLLTTTIAATKDPATRLRFSILFTKYILVCRVNGTLASVGDGACIGRYRPFAIVNKLLLGWNWLER